MSTPENWARLETEYVKTLSVPGRCAVNPAVVAPKMLQAVRDGFAKGDRHDWFRQNGALAEAVRNVFGFKTTKAWRDAWYPK